MHKNPTVRSSLTAQHVYGFDYIYVYKYMYCDFTVFMLPASTVSGAKMRYTCCGERKGRDGRRGNCRRTQRFSSNPHFLHWWNAPSDCFYYLRKKVPIQNPAVLKWSFYRHKEIFPHPSIWFLFSLRPGYSNRYLQNIMHWNQTLRSYSWYWRSNIPPVYHIKPQGCKLKSV